MRISLGEPHHGWLPVKIKTQNDGVEFEASDVPVDPLLLTESLISAIKGNDYEVWWHLEPGGYYLAINNKNGCYEVSLSFSQDSSSNKREQLFVIEGTAEDTIIPMWRTLKEFYSHGYQEPHWPEHDETELEKLTVLIKQLKSKKA